MSVWVVQSIGVRRGEALDKGRMRNGWLEHLVRFPASKHPKWVDARLVHLREGAARHHYRRARALPNREAGVVTVIAAALQIAGDVR